MHKFLIVACCIARFIITKRIPTYQYRSFFTIIAHFIAQVRISRFHVCQLILICFAQLIIVRINSLTRQDSSTTHLTLDKLTEFSNPFLKIIMMHLLGTEMIPHTFDITDQSSVEFDHSVKSTIVGFFMGAIAI